MAYKSNPVFVAVGWQVDLPGKKLIRENDILPGLPIK